MPEVLQVDFAAVALAAEENENDHVGHARWIMNRVVLGKFGEKPGDGFEVGTDDLRVVRVFERRATSRVRECSVIRVVQLVVWQN